MRQLQPLIQTPANHASPSSVRARALHDSSGRSRSRKAASHTPAVSGRSSCGARQEVLCGLSRVGEAGAGSGLAVRLSRWSHSGSTAMCDAVLLDLVHGCATCAGAAAPDGPRVFLLCGKRPWDTSSLAGRRVHVLDGGSTAECLYRFKQTVDELELSSVLVLTSPRGRRALLAYQRQLFTGVYSFEYRLTAADCLTCRSRAGSAHTDSPAEEVSEFLQLLPALRGHVSVLRSTLIPGRGFPLFHLNCLEVIG